MRPIQVGDRYRITNNEDEPDKWVRSPRRITQMSLMEIQYTCDNGEYFVRQRRMIEGAIRDGEWVLDYPPVIALPQGV